jgi:HAD superfamily phosphatase (TIGR01681 family)
MVCSNAECKLIIFDLDGTLHTFADIHNNKAVLKKDVLDILITLKQKGIKIALASLNSNAIQYLNRYKITKYFDYIEYKNWGLHGNFKRDLFESISKKSNIPFEKMLFFDDNLYHYEEATSLGIKSIMVDRENLLTWSDFYKGLSLFDCSLVCSPKMITVETQTCIFNTDYNTNYNTFNEDVVRRQGTNYNTDKYPHKYKNMYKNMYKRIKLL